VVKRVRHHRPVAVCTHCTKYVMGKAQHFDDIGNVLCLDCYNEWLSSNYCEDCGYKWNECQCKKECGYDGQTGTARAETV